jgi:hypothetical protein
MYAVPLRRKMARSKAKFCIVAQRLEKVNSAKCDLMDVTNLHQLANYDGRFPGFFVAMPRFLEERQIQ